MPIRIDEITLQGGRIGLADHFVKPNYAATLGDLGGRVTGLSSEDGTVATLDLRGSLANHSPLQVSGTINPLAAAQFADVKATFRDIDLPSFTPYSGKYAGYAIASGSLTMEVAYKVVNRKLTASNRLLLNQFELGDKVDSKDATKLPVKFAVSLLKDKDGVIDLDLPIEGSLDDPKFRIGKIVWQVLGNLIAKAVTAPFALLGKLFGGKSDELSTVDFPDGLATLDDAGKKKLDALAKALAARPALKLQATGRFSPEDVEGLRRARVERKIKAQKLPDLVKSGAAPAGVDDVVVEPAERETYLKKAYKREKFPKPSTGLGFAKDLPGEEMEKLMLANEAVGDDDLRQLALARSNAVKDYLVGTAAADPARVFVLEPGAQAAAPKENARASRVDFTLK
jgi:outer membrane protein OmpA-like peptidoglycan-associated protein